MFNAFMHVKYVKVDDVHWVYMYCTLILHK
jgi:hypothetical protein